MFKTVSDVKPSPGHASVQALTKSLAAVRECCEASLGHSGEATNGRLTTNLVLGRKAAGGETKGRCLNLALLSPLRFEALGPRLATNEQKRREILTHS